MNYPIRDKDGLQRFVSVADYRAALRAFEQDQYRDSLFKLDRCISESYVVGTCDDISVAECWLLVAWNAQRLGDFSSAASIHDWLEDAGSIAIDRKSTFVLERFLELADGNYQGTLLASDNEIRVAVERSDLAIHDLLLCRGVAHARLGHSSRARADFEAGYEIARVQRLNSWMVDNATYCGVVEIQLGRYVKAIEWNTKALTAALELGATARTGRCHLNLGICHYKLGNYRPAADHLNSAEDFLSAIQDHANQTRTQIALGNVHRLTRDFAAARQHLTQAYTMATDLKIPREECLALEFLGDVLRDEGKPEEARRYYQRGMAIALDIAPEGDLVMELLRREGECLIHEGKAGEGLEILIRARDHAKKLGDRFEEGVVLRCLAEGLLAAGDLEPAVKHADHAAAQLEEISARHEHAIARLTLAEILLQQSETPAIDEPRDKLDQAWEQTLIAQSLCRQLDIDHWTNRVKNLQSRIARRRAEEIRYASAKQEPRKAAGDRYEPGDIIIAQSRAMQEVMQAIEAFSPYDEPILLTGETGTGKEVVARRVHQMSLRKDKPFVAVNVTAIPQTMFEREFFGHVKGSFSGADHDRTGLAAEADGGTLFLDEIGDLPSATQAKFLRILQDGSYLCLGDPVERRADLRIIAATNSELETDVREGRFREDLYYRLAILEIPLSPLRNRPEDIRPLLDHFLSLSAGRQVSAERYFNELSLRLLAKYGWPGNVREVALVARRAHISLQTSGRVEIEVGSGEDAMVLRGQGQVAAKAAAGGASAAGDADALSRARILLALEETGGNRAAAARLLGVARATLYRRLAKLGLD